MAFRQDWEPMVLRKTIQTENKRKKPLEPIRDKVICEEEMERPKILGKEGGNLLQKKRCEKGLTQKKLGMLINIDSNTIRDYEGGNVIPEHHILLKICKALGLRISEVKK